MDRESGIEIEKIMLQAIRKYSGSEKELQRTLRRSGLLAGLALSVAVIAIGFLIFRVSGNLGLTVAGFALAASFSVAVFVTLGMVVDRGLDSMLKSVVRTFLDHLGSSKEEPDPK